MTPLTTLSAFLLDMDGTLYLGKSRLPGAEELIQTLRETGRRHLYLANSPSSDGAAYAEKLRGMGIPAEAGEVFTAGAATADHVARDLGLRRVFALGTPSFEEELRRAGVDPAAEDPEAVVLAFDKTLTYAKLERACLLLREGLPYIASNPDKVCPTDYGYIPDCGAMAALLFEATGRTPHFVGKPSPEFARLALDRLGAKPEEAAMVGDRLYTDMEMARLAGMTGILLLSGETRPEDLDGAPHQPAYVFEHAGGLARALRGAADAAIDAATGA